MKKKILLLGHTGKVGLALNEVLKEDYEIIGKNSEDFDASDFEKVKKMVGDVKPDILINTVAFLGIDSCEKEPEKALKLNTLFPKFLAKFSNELGFLLIHFSTDAVFNNEKDDFLVETDTPKPLNVYGFTKYGGDCFVQAIASKYYIFRLSVMFGKAIKNNQFIEKMLEKIENGEKILRLADDIVCSPSYSLDIAKEIKNVIESSKPYDLYHTVNKGKATLYEIMNEIVTNLKLEVKIKKASYNDFPFVGIKNVNTPMTSKKLKSLRNWKESIKEYTDNMEFK